MADVRYECTACDVRGTGAACWFCLSRDPATFKPLAELVLPRQVPEALGDPAEYYAAMRMLGLA